MTSASTKPWPSPTKCGPQLLRLPLRGQRIAQLNDLIGRHRSHPDGVFIAARGVFHRSVCVADAGHRPTASAGAPAIRFADISTS
jgi:hypothetical protein